MNAWDWFAIILAAAGTAIALYGAYVLFGLLILPFVLIYRLFTIFSPNQPMAVSDDFEEGHRPAKKEKKKEVEWPPHHEYYFPSSRDEAEGANSPYWSD